MIIGFTGTRWGMSASQKTALGRWLLQFLTGGSLAPGESSNVTAGSRGDRASMVDTEGAAGMIGKTPLELHHCSNGARFLNFWDSAHGKDVCCKIVNGKLMLGEYDEQGEEKDPREISLLEFVELVEKSIRYATKRQRGSRNDPPP